ncbi:FAD/NAD(P)-binding oxidoreductase [Nocardioides zeae]|uniref:FAD/NAD(P)-binding oxidoreductase n=1 Tax=Nocardioides imazamoxiresistens TaxID=3231893 RepID=A0ABU3PTL4_9ACTN|nr:FAD/NAD(P)-binding oxidoreductase [Nocardioides zeae]MDT9592534.1 FAD/NAD(P)-binding oxidoreductase [Nocardioides zeae]
MSAEHRFDYVIVGGGMSADAAAKGIRELDRDGTIAVLGEEPTPPFPRPALSKKLWTDPDFGLDDAALATADSTGASVRLDTAVEVLDAEARTVTTAAGEQYAYGRLLLATGGRPRQVAGLEPGPRVLYYRTLTDYHRLRELAASHPRVTVVGGGWIGTEIAAALVQNGCTVTLVHPDGVLGASFLAPTLAQRYEDLFRTHGVQLLPGRRATGGRSEGDAVHVDLDDGTTLDSDVVVVGLGIEPAGELATAAGITTADDGSVIVDSHLATSAPGVWAAGDVATYPDRILGRTRVEHVDNATTMGTVAGRVLAGSGESYDHTPYFYSEVFGTRFEAIGTLDPSAPLVEDHLNDERSVVYHLSQDGRKVVGVLLWQVEDGLDEARTVLARQPVATGAGLEDLVGRIG